MDLQSSPPVLLFRNLVIIIFIAIVLPPPPTNAFASFLNPLKSLFNQYNSVETCSPPHVPDSTTSIDTLRYALAAELFGQHLAQKTIPVALKMHLDDSSPKKAMVLSLHGWAGSGKTFTTQLITKSLYKAGEQSGFVRFFSATYHFPDHDPVAIRKYKETLMEAVKGTVRKCGRAIFIFDEADKFPQGLLDVLVPLVKSSKLEPDLDCRKATFIFLSNAGGSQIRDITLKARENGRSRESLQLVEFEDILSNEVFSRNEGGGLYKSELIEKILVDFFVPFLPMERKQVIQCIERDVRKFGGGARRGEVDIEVIADQLTYWPEDKKWFSQSGCKKVENLVKFQLTESQFGKKEL